MGLFRPLNEEISPEKVLAYKKMRAQKDDKYLEKVHNDRHKRLNQALGLGTHTHTKFIKSNSSKSSIIKPYKESAAASLLGLSDEELYKLNEGNCDSDTCKCKGGTCPVSVTDGISTSSYAAKKLANAGSSNQTDLNAVVPNAEYSRQNDALFIGDGDSPETSKTNIPAILAAKTAGGSPHGWTTDNGINGTSNNVFKLRKLRDDDDGPNG